MTANESSSAEMVRERESASAPTASELPFVFEDRTDAKTRAALFEVAALAQWVRAQRAMGHLPD